MSHSSIGAVSLGLPLVPPIRLLLSIERILKLLLLMILFPTTLTDTETLHTALTVVGSPGGARLSAIAVDLSERFPA